MKIMQIYMYKYNIEREKVVYLTNTHAHTVNKYEKYILV
jgi:hypothetical protein